MQINEICVYLAPMNLSALSNGDWIWLCLGALLIGMAKAGISGVGMLAVPIMAAIFGGKPSSGLVLPMLIIADMFAVVYYKRHAQWPHIWALLPAAALGVLLGLAVGYWADDRLFAQLIAIIVFASLGLMLWQEFRGLPARFTGNRIFSWTFGLLGGFSTMIGNAAGPVLNTYLLSTRLSKDHFIGTAAWFFFIVNLFKLPFHIWVWHTVNKESILLNLAVIPAIALGIYIGIRTVRLIPEREFRYFIIVATIVASLKLLW